MVLRLGLIVRTACSRYTMYSVEVTILQFKNISASSKAHFLTESGHSVTLLFLGDILYIINFLTYLFSYACNTLSVSAQHN